MEIIYDFIPMSGLYHNNLPPIQSRCGLVKGPISALKIPRLISLVVWPTLEHQMTDPKLSSDFEILFPAQDKSHLERPADGFPQLLPCSVVHVLKAKMSSNNLLFGTPFIFGTDKLHRYPEVCAYGQNLYSSISYFLVAMLAPSLPIWTRIL